jgi:hypothetical protein
MLQNKVMKKLFLLINLMFAFHVEAKNSLPDLRICKADADCIMIDINCGRPGTVNKKYKNYTEAPKGCDASMNYVEQSKRYQPACVSGECKLLRLDIKPAL